MQFVATLVIAVLFITCVVDSSVTSDKGKTKMRFTLMKCQFSL